MTRLVGLLVHPGSCPLLLLHRLIFSVSSVSIRACWIEEIKYLTVLLWDLDPARWDVVFAVRIICRHLSVGQLVLARREDAARVIDGSNTPQQKRKRHE